MKSMDPTEVLRYYVYTYAYPISMGGKVFYIGKGTKDRLYHHLAEARKGVDSPKCDIIREILARDEEVVIKKVRDGLSSRDAYRLEDRLIMQYGYHNLTNKPLERRKETLFPRIITVFSSIRDQVEPQVLAQMENEGIELTPNNCRKYLENIFNQALLSFRKEG